MERCDTKTVNRNVSHLDSTGEAAGLGSKKTLVSLYPLPYKAKLTPKIKIFISLRENKYTIWTNTWRIDIVNIATFHLTVRQQDTLQLREQPGSMLRGAFGHALRELACITDLPDCKQCPLNQTCQYTRIFETQFHPNPSKQPAIQQSLYYQTAQ